MVRKRKVVGRGYGRDGRGGSTFGWPICIIRPAANSHIPHAVLFVGTPRFISGQVLSVNWVMYVVGPAIEVGIRSESNGGAPRFQVFTTSGERHLPQVRGQHAIRVCVMLGRQTTQKASLVGLVERRIVLVMAWSSIRSSSVFHQVHAGRENTD